MSDLALVITAVAALVAAVGGIVAAALASRAKVAADNNASELVVVGDQVRALGKRMDGPLSELLVTTRALARAEGVAAGEQAQRDRTAEAQP